MEAINMLFYDLIAIQSYRRTSEDERRRLLNAPVWVDIICVLGIMFLFYLLLKKLMSFSDRWRKMMNERIEKALLARRSVKDDFRTINGYSWDYLMVFRVYNHKERLTSKQNNGMHSLKGLVNLMAESGLETKLFFSVQNDEVYCKIRASLERLLKEAGRIEFKLCLEPASIANALRAGNNSGPEENHWASIEIPRSELTSIEPYDFIYGKFIPNDPDKFFWYKKYGNGTILRSVDRLKLIASIITAHTDHGGCQLDVYKLLSMNEIEAFFPLHDLVELRELEEKWLVFFQLPWRQNVDAVKDYYGEKIGMYFLWLGHYTSWLLFASICGFITWCNVASNGINAKLIPYYATFIAIWATYFFEYWKRKEKHAAMKWGTVGFEDTEQERPEFHGDIVPSPIDGTPRRYFPRRKYYMRITYSSISISCLILVVIVALIAIFYFRISTTLSGVLIVGNVQFSGTVASLMNAVQIQIMNFVYQKVSVFLNDYENYRTETLYEDALIAKTFIFQFVNSFAACLYVAFVKPFIQTLDPCTVSCLDELETTLGTIFLTRLATGSVLKVLLPYIDQYNRKKEETKGVNEDELSEVEKLFLLTPYHVTLDIFADYAEMVIQFGYATMFICAYPLATIVSFINNYVEMRVEAWKLCQLCRRPEPRSCEDIGTWLLILECTSVFAVFSNAGIVAFTSTLTRGFQWTDRSWIFFGMAFGILLLKVYVSVQIDDIAPETVIQLKRQDLIIRKLFENEGDDDNDTLEIDVSTKAQYTIRLTDDDPL